MTTLAEKVLELSSSQPPGSTFRARMDSVASAFPSAASLAAAILAAAQVTPIHSNNKLINGAEVIGDGTDGNDWRGVGVQPQ